MNKLSDHFSYEEGVHSKTAKENDIDNTPDDDTLKRMVIAANGMEKVREILGHPITPTSWYRCEALEKIIAHRDYVRWCKYHHHHIDGESWVIYFKSKGHPKGYSVDFHCDGFGTPSEIVEELRKSDIMFDQLICEGTWVHISFDPMMRNQVMNATFDDDGTPHYSSRKTRG